MLWDLLPSEEDWTNLICLNSTEHEQPALPSIQAGAPHRKVMAHLMENILGGMSNPHSAQTVSDSVSYVNISLFPSFPWYDVMKQVMTMGGHTHRARWSITSFNAFIPWEKDNSNPQSLGSWGYPGVPVTDMAQAQLEALKALQATNAGAGKGKVWRRIKEPRGAEQGHER